MRNQVFHSVLCCLMLVSLAGCARYKSRPLSVLSNKTRLVPFVDNGSVSFSYKIFDKRDCKKFLDRDVIAKGYQPIQLIITNYSKETVYFSLKNITIPTVDPYVVAKSVHTNTAARAVGYGVTSLIVWPFVIPALVDGIGSAHANEALDRDFEKKTLRDQTIEAHCSINGLIFVPVELFKPHFHITLVEQKTARKVVLASDVCYAETQYV